MAVPKQHRSKSRQGQRRMHLFLKNPSTLPCAHCGKEIASHTACAFCGHYKGKAVVNTSKTKKKKRTAHTHA
ncbi:MAG: 50S ribosomal protein L32 [Candidatus Wildermuthbacteria bacterium]|nr:50S ribosomal protein L32 [Candidatus Wildermuthbacteria bacterium]MBI2121330.1 50S ribosomal protein L32 [Candidatus Wildermuthbacteria bacterium]MBI2647758.1 50S ribosomal protein L32 [Candidatus Wildermuthbacteria bacterium]